MVYLSALEFPSAEDLRSRRDNEQLYKQRLAKSTADRLLSELANNCPELAVVVIEIEDNRRFSSDDGTVPDYDGTTYAFIRSKQTDLYGNTSIVGMAVETHMVKHYEPCSDVLDTTASLPYKH
jgi:hypothetical protein